MMLHRKDFENHNFNLKIHCKPIYSVRYACSGPEGIIYYSKSMMPPKIQETNVPLFSTTFMWLLVDFLLVKNIYNIIMFTSTSPD